ncbi:histidine kinase [Alicyclobacillus ferrooxydans]|uniref:Oxygen sensor histidine kinase NreB n=2 Tax=Alicyclobacillus ferrooxydans TaxID=471514 RepID=A0A0P9GPX8_9BACL|nr:histidine kinase [Alicyclobacillus ferrooxydans]
MSPGDLPIFDQTDHGIKLIEEERRRIARDLHDGPAQAITNVSMRLDIIRRLLQTQPALVEEEVDRLQQKVRVLVSDVRRLIYDLRPVAVDEVGVLQATLQLCERNQHDWNLKIEVSVQEDVSLDIAPARQVAIYRLIQELLNNVHKHAEATNVKIAFSQSKSDLIIQVADNGKGFDPDLIPEGHYGLAGMKERIEYLDGTFLIESAPGTGARFEIRLPVYE